MLSVIMLSVVMLNVVATNELCLCEIICSADHKFIFASVLFLFSVTGAQNYYNNPLSFRH